MSRRRRATLALALAAAALPTAPAVDARADDVWAEATRPEDERAARRAYDEAMAAGDAAAQLAASDAASTATLRKRVRAAVEAYHRASRLAPHRAEPHWRAAGVLFAFYVDCSPDLAPLCLRGPDPEVYRQILAHWHEFSNLAPLDPRITQVLFDRALLHTKLATEDDLRAAAVDYEALLDREAAGALSRANAYGNLAEAYMMLGDLDRAIGNYLEAMQQSGSSVSHGYGLAVAYDRDGQGERARELMAALGTRQFQRWLGEVAAGSTFYVPEGEVHYYAALAQESLGDDAPALAAWQAYLDSGAHPRYQPRAREHVERLRRRLAGAAPPTPRGRR